MTRTAHNRNETIVECKLSFWRSFRRGDESIGPLRCDRGDAAPEDLPSRGVLYKERVPEHQVIMRASEAERREEPWEDEEEEEEEGALGDVDR